MENYRTGSHNRFDIKYHFVWVTKYRRKVLTGEVGIRVRDLVREVCLANEIEIGIVDIDTHALRRGRRGAEPLSGCTAGAGSSCTGTLG